MKYIWFFFFAQSDSIAFILIQRLKLRKGDYSTFLNMSRRLTFFIIYAIITVIFYNLLRGFYADIWNNTRFLLFDVIVLKMIQRLML